MMDTEDELDGDALAASMRTSLSRLPSLQRYVLELYFGFHDDEARSLADIAQHLGRSENEVRELKDAALLRLRYLAGS